MLFRCALPFAVLLVFFLGCSPGPMGRLNEIEVRNRSKEQIDRVVISWDEDEYTFDPKKFGPNEEFTNITKKITVYGELDTIMKIDIHYLGLGEPVEHYAKLQLKSDERKLVEIDILDDQKISLSQRQRSPDIF